MMSEDPRTVLERLCAERGEDFASLSRLLGKNSAYIQQYLRRGTPKRLREEERRTLAAYFNIPESMLGAPGEERLRSAMVAIMRAPVRASAGAGSINGDESERPYFAFDERWLKRMTTATTDDLVIIRVEGDSMAPTLGDGDDILIDRGDCGDRLRDGIYVMRVDESLIVKRLAINPVTRRVTVQSDNPAYPDWPDLAIDSINSVGRVIWAARRVA